jgi:uncharacterized protein YcgL (UPF0745 family)
LEAILDRRLRRKKKLVEITMSKVSQDFGEQAQYMVIGEFTEKSSIAGG